MSLAKFVKDSAKEGFLCENLQALAPPCALQKHLLGAVSVGLRSDPSGDA